MHKRSPLGIVRVVLVQALHRLLVAFGTGLVVDLVVILIEDLDRSEVFGLAGRLRLRGFALLDRFWPALRFAGGKGGTSGLGSSPRTGEALCSGGYSNGNCTLRSGWCALTGFKAGRSIQIVYWRSCTEGIGWPAETL